MSTGDQREYLVEGMTCQHCATSVTEEVSDLAGVEYVDVDLSAGRLIVTGSVSEDAVRDAVDQAGYQVVA